MKTLAGWIVGVFGLGLLVGSFYGGTIADADAERTTLESALESAPLVDCGSGREAVLEPVLVDGRTTVRFKCTPAESAREERVVFVPRAAAVAPVTAAPAPTPTVAATNIPETPDRAEAREKRSVKDSALIIGGSAGAGAGIGAIAKGKKGAALGAAIGGVAVTVYDLVTRNKDKQ